MRRILFLSLVFVMTACQTAAAVIPPTPTFAPATYPTATVEWFPPTSTVEIQPTKQPTPTQTISTELGEVIFTDDFSDSEGWTVPQSGAGEINIGNGEANIIINESRTFLYGTLEKPDLSDFYAEITVSPILCAGRDEYGFLFRVIGRDQYYRFAISCDGEVRLDRITPGGGMILFPWTRSGSVPPGAPSVSKIAVLAEKDQLHLFINGDLQASVSDQQLKIGSFGIFARSTGESAVTVSFSDLIVRDVIQK
jgi:hypothetical protein